MDRKLLNGIKLYSSVQFAITNIFCKNEDIQWYDQSQVPVCSFILPPSTLASTENSNVYKRCHKYTFQNYLALQFFTNVSKTGMNGVILLLFSANYSTSGVTPGAKVCKRSSLRKRICYPFNKWGKVSQCRARCHVLNTCLPVNHQSIISQVSFLSSTLQTYKHNLAVRWSQPSHCNHKISCFSPPPNHTGTRGDHTSQ